MELTYDWRGFQAIFHPHRRSGSAKASEIAPPLYLVVDNQQVVSACAGGTEDVSPWIGMSLPKLTAELPHREILLFERKEVDQWFGGALALPHFYDQIEYLRSQAAPQAISAGGKLKPAAGQGRRHFLLEAISGWWAKVLPSAYGLFIRMETRTGAASRSIDSPQEIFVVVRRGRIDLFHSPDLSSLDNAIGMAGGGIRSARGGGLIGGSRSRDAAAVVKYLSEKHLVPVQGLLVSEEDWLDWSNPDHASLAWGKMLAAIRNRRAKLVPSSWKIRTLLASRAFFGI